MASRYDAVVVGAGPAGSAVSLLLQQEGARVLLVDREIFPRDKACGGGLTPRGVGALERLGIELSPAHALRVHGIEMVLGRGPVALPFPVTSSWPGYGLVGRRSVVDALLLEAARGAGVEVRTGTRVLGPRFEGGVCRGVRLRSGSGTEDVEATWTVAADGATSVVARAAGLAPLPSREGFWYAAVRAYFAPVQPRGTLLEFYPLRTPSGRWLPGYGWLFPLPDGSANVGVDLPHHPPLAGCPPLHEAFRAFVERLRRERPGFEAARLEGRVVGALLPEAMRSFRSGAPGLLCVGDAAGTITPYSGEGICYALEGAEHAARAILRSERPSEVASAYARSLREAWGFQFSSAHRVMRTLRWGPAARAAAMVGGRSPRILRAAIRVMAFLLEDSPEASSTTARLWRTARRVWEARVRD